MLCRLVSRKRKTGRAPVFLNVYDLTPINGYPYWLGLGVYHSGVQVHGVEYGFGAHDHTTTGIFEVEPKQCPGFTFRKSISIGGTDLGPEDVRALMEKLSKEYSGNKYNLITKNCNHFCHDVSLKLTGKPIPKWVNRLARLESIILHFLLMFSALEGLFCNCVLPAGLNEKKVGQVKSVGKHGELEKGKLRSNSSRYATSSIPPRSASSTTRTNRQRRCVPTSSSLIHHAPNPVPITLKV